MIGGRMITTVLFDLDGTLLPMDQELFIKAYFKALRDKLVPFGYDGDEIVDVVWKGTAAMVLNDGSCKNETAFWRVFASHFGEERMNADIPLFDEFYKKDFDEIKPLLGYDATAASTVNRLKEKGLRLVLATNPVFPAAAVEKRVSWAGLSIKDFELYTTYSNSSFCKPSVGYYTEILEKLKLSPESCLMVGNDVEDDMIAATLGMKVFLLTSCLINKKGVDISVYPNGGFAELYRYIEENV